MSTGPKITGRASTRSGLNDQAMKAKRAELREAREQLVLHRKPLTTVYLASREVLQLLGHSLHHLLQRRLLSATILTLLLLAVGVYATTENQDILAWYLRGYEALFWLVLGILSSVGLGTGLHTFILYLGPYIAHVTMHAYSCGTTDLPAPFHSTRPGTWSAAVCPAVPEGGHPPVTLFTIIRSVQFQAFMWGAGTALGELPPYFVARAARLSQDQPDEDDEDLQDLHETLHAKDDSLLGRAKRSMHYFVQKAGFIGILLCASIPNPLFDLAGLTCGHFLIPFQTFFLATLIGKAVIKVHIQVVSLVVVMSKPVFDQLLESLKGLPAFGDKLHAVLLNARESAQAKFASDAPHEKPEMNPLALAVAGLVISMILYFLVSIVNQLAQRHQHRRDKVTLGKIKSQ